MDVSVQRLRRTPGLYRGWAPRRWVVDGLRDVTRGRFGGAMYVALRLSAYVRRRPTSGWSLRSQRDARVVVSARDVPSGGPIPNPKVVRTRHRVGDGLRGHCGGGGAARESVGCVGCRVFVVRRIGAWEEASRRGSTKIHRGASVDAACVSHAATTRCVTTGAAGEAR